MHAFMDLFMDLFIDLFIDLFMDLFKISPHLCVFMRLMVFKLPGIFGSPHFGVFLTPFSGNVSGADPYCVVKVEGQTCNTPVVKDTLTARFDSSFVFFTKRPDQRPVKVEVWDKNVLKDKHLGEIELTLPKAGEGRQYTEKLRAKGDATKETQGTLSVTLEWFTDTTSR